MPPSNTNQQLPVFKTLFCLIIIVIALINTALFEDLVVYELFNAIIIVSLLYLIRLLSYNNTITLIITNEKDSKNSTN